MGAHSVAGTFKMSAITGTSTVAVLSVGGTPGSVVGSVTGVSSRRSSACGDPWGGWV